MNNRGGAWPSLQKALLGTAVGMVAAILFTGCALVPMAPQTAKQLARGALQSWSKAGGFRFRGDATGAPVGEASMHFTVTESPDGEQAKGNGTLGGEPFSYLAVPGKEAAPGKNYLEGLSFWKEYYRKVDPGDARAAGFGDGFVQPKSDNSVANFLRGLTNMRGLLQSQMKNLKKGPGARSVGGKRATPVIAHSDGKTYTFWIAQGTSDQLVGFSLSGQSTWQYNATIAEARAPHTVTPAGATVKEWDLQTLPAWYEPLDTGYIIPGCQSLNSCELAADIRNDAGPTPAGTATVTITTASTTMNAEQGNDNARCTANVPAIKPGDTTRVYCTTSAPQWQQVALEAGNEDGTFIPNLIFLDTAVTVTTPPYGKLKYTATPGESVP